MLNTVTISSMLIATAATVYYIRTKAPTEYTRPAIVTQKEAPQAKSTYVEPVILQEADPTAVGVCAFTLIASGYSDRDAAIECINELRVYQ